MKFPLLASFIVFGITLTYGMRKASRRKEQQDDSFWDREREANTTLRKPLDDLVFVEVPLEDLPFGVLADNEIVEDCERMIRTYENKKSVNLTGFTNTDLKFRYGAPNLQILTIYDNNYTQLIRTLHKWAEELLKNNYIAEAECILSYAISTGSDIIKSYELLAKIYADRQDTDALSKLRDAAEALNSMSKNVILRNLDSLQGPA